MENKDFKVLFIYPNTMMATLLPLNISQLSACLKKKGFKVELFDTTYYPTEEINFEKKKVNLLQIKPYEFPAPFKKTDIYEDLKNKIIKYSPDLICVTLVQDTLEIAFNLLESLKKYYNIPVIVGGVYVYSSIEELLKKDFINMACMGEGEEALVELCEKMVRHEDITSIKNIWVKKNGKIIKNIMREPVDINKLPYIDFSIYEESRLGRPMHGKIFKMLHVEIDRGCSYACTYCEAPIIRKRYRQDIDCKYYRQKNIKRIIGEMKYLKNTYSPNYIDFNSESFLTRKVENLRSFAEMYKKEIGLPFWCQSRPEEVTEEKIQILKEMGCADLQYGIEHGNYEFRKKMLNRHVSNDDILRGCFLTEKYKIPYTVNNIIGFPTETRELIWDTISLNRKIKPKTMNCYFFTPYKGTWLYKYCVENNYLDLNSKTLQLLDGANIRYDTITREELYGLQRAFSLYARLDRKWFPLIEKAEKFDEEGNMAFNILKKEFYKIMNWRE